jgi:WD40 repeat protein
MIEKVLPDAGRMCVAWAPDGRLLAADGRLWDACTWEVRLDLRPPHPFRITFSRDGAILFIFSTPGSRGDLVQARDVASGRLLWSYGSRLDPYPVAFDPLGRYISLDGDSCVKFIDTMTGRVVPGKEIRVGSTSSNSFSADGRLLYVMVHAQPRLLVADVETCRILADVTFVEDALSDDVPLTDEEACAWDSRDYDNPLIRERFGSWGCPTPSPDGKWMSMDNENMVTYFLARDLGSWRLVHRLYGIKPKWGRQLHGWIQASAWSPDSHFFARAHQGHPGFVSIVEASSGTWQVVGVFPHESGGVNDVAFSPDGQRFASIGTDNTCRIWRVPGRD